MTAETYGYTYDANGNITSISKNGSVINRYEYDSLNQLIREDNIEADYTELFVYDDSGNLYVRCKLDACTDIPTSQIGYSDGTITSYVCDDETWGDLLTRYNNTNINYDQIGNPLNWRNVSSFTWSGRQLDSAVLSNSIGIAYTYNSDGIRTRRVIEGSYVYDYVLDGTKILCETVTSNGTEIYKYYYLYDEKGSIIGFQDATATYYYQKNLQGDIIRILNAEGVVLVEYTYNAFGEVLSVTGSHASTLGQRNPFRYRGYYYDKETGFYYLNSRYYDPTVGRFLNADAYTSTGQGILGNNMFAYCGNNPIMFIDSNGYFSFSFDDFCDWAGDAFDDICNSAEDIYNDTVDWIEDTYNGAVEQIEYGVDLHNNITEVKSDIVEIAFDNVTASGGICIGIGGSFELGVTSVEAISRMDIFGAQYRDGEFEIGHNGKSAFSFSWGPFSIGPQSETFETTNPYTRQVYDDTNYDISISQGCCGAFFIGGHYSVSFSVLGFVEDIIEYIDKR